MIWYMIGELHASPAVVSRSPEGDYDLNGMIVGQAFEALR